MALDCGHEPQPTYYTAGSRITVGDETVTMTGDEIMFPGYATVAATGERICPDCADRRQREEMCNADHFFAYLSTDARHVTTWTGGELGRVTSHHVSSRAHKTYVQVTGLDGSYWTGQGPAESGTYVSLRRVRTS